MTSKQAHREVVELTKELIRFPSTKSRPEAIHHCADFICDWLTRHNIVHIRHDEKQVPSIYALPKPGYAPVLLMTHFDVVESESDTLFSPCEREGRLFGRGAIDDKYGVAMSLILLREHILMAKKNNLSQNDVPFGILLTGDEEQGGMKGAKKLAQSITTDFFLAIDGGNPKLIVVKEKGRIGLTLRATGKGAHAARPWFGQSGFDLLVDDYARMQALFSQSTDDHWHKTMVLTNCQAGNGSTNMLPKHATATFDIRYTDHDDPDSIIDSICKSLSSEVTVHSKEPVFSSTPSPYLDLLVSYSGGAALGFEHGASDARYFSAHGVPGAIWGAEGEMSQHTDNEHIVIDSLNNLYDRIDAFLANVNGS